MGVASLDKIASVCLLLGGHGITLHITCGNAYTSTEHCHSGCKRGAVALFGVEQKLVYKILTAVGRSGGEAVGVVVDQIVPDCRRLGGSAAVLLGDLAGKISGALCHRVGQGGVGFFEVKRILGEPIGIPIVFADQ